MLKQWILVLRRFTHLVAALLSICSFLVVAAVGVLVFRLPGGTPAATMSAPSAGVEENQIDQEIDFLYSPTSYGVYETKWVDETKGKFLTCIEFASCAYFEITKAPECAALVIVEFSMWGGFDNWVIDSLLVIEPENALGIHELGTNQNIDFETFQIDNLRCSLPHTETEAL